MAQDKKYQIFISSTYEDLKEARSKVMDSILSMYHIPIGMEMFSAADDEQWEIIRSTIDTSDYYVVIIGFRYGSTTPEGISYTEKEYDYAISRGIPVLAFIRDRNTPVSSAERDDNQEMIKAFIRKAQGKMRNSWSTPDNLAKNVSIALHKEFDRKPRIGWIRADHPSVSNSSSSISDHEFAKSLSSDILPLQNQLEANHLLDLKNELDFLKDSMENSRLKWAKEQKNLSDNLTSYMIENTKIKESLAKYKSIENDYKLSLIRTLKYQLKILQIKKTLSAIGFMRIF